MQHSVDDDDRAHRSVEASGVHLGLLGLERACWEVFVVNAVFEVSPETVDSLLELLQGQGGLDVEELLPKIVHVKTMQVLDESSEAGAESFEVNSRWETRPPDPLNLEGLEQVDSLCLSAVRNLLHQDIFSSSINSQQYHVFSGLLFNNLNVLSEKVSPSSAIS